MEMIRMTPRFRWWAGFLTAFCAISSAGIASDAGPYNTPIFQTVHSVMPWPWWAAVWGVIGCVSLYATATLSQAAWRVASLMSVATAVTWLSGVCWERFVDGAKVSPTGFGLWIWFAGSNFLAATAGAQFERKP